MPAAARRRACAAGLLLLLALPSSAAVGEGLLLRIFPDLKTDPAGIDSLVWEVDQAGRKTWIATNNGLYEVVGYQAIRRPCGRNGKVTAIEEVNGRTWVGTEDGLFELDGAECAPLVEQGFGGVQKVKVRTEPDTGAIVEVLLSKPRGGLFRLSAAAIRRRPPYRPEPIAEVAGEVSVFETVAGVEWVGTDQGVFEIGQDGRGKAVLKDAPRNFPKSCLAIGPWRDRTCFILTAPQRDTRLVCRELDGSLDEDPLHSYKSVTAFGAFRDGPHYGTTSNVWKLDAATSPPDPVGGSEQPVLSLDKGPNEPVPRVGPINRLLIALGRDVVVTYQRFYWRKQGEWAALPAEPSEPLGLTHGKEVDGHLWLWGPGGAFVFEEKGAIELAFNGELRNRIWVLSADPLKPQRATYLDAQGVPLGLQAERTFFDAKLASSRPDPKDLQAGIEQLHGRGWSPAEVLRVPFAELTGDTLIFSVRDKLGNRVTSSVKYEIPPKPEPEPESWWEEWLGLGLLAVVVIVLGWFFSPYARWARKLLAEVAGWGELPAKLMSVFLAFGGTWRILAVYRRYLKDEATNDASLPDRSSVLKHLAESLKHRHALGICADQRKLEALKAGLLRELSSQEAMVAPAGQEREHKRLRGTLPIFLSLESLPADAEEKIEAIRKAAARHLEGHGELEGFNLAEVVLMKRPFVIVLDGATRVETDQLLQEWPGKAMLYARSCLWIIERPCLRDGARRADDPFDWRRGSSPSPRRASSPVGAEPRDEPPPQSV